MAFLAGHLSRRLLTAVAAASRVVPLERELLGSGLRLVSCKAAAASPRTTGFLVISAQPLSTSATSRSTKEWSQVMSKAEKVVGYPTSFLNLRYLVSDEVAHFANLLRKLMKTKHPLINMVRRLIMNNDSDSKRAWQVHGLFILLISKAAGVPRNRFVESEISDGIHQSQRCLAEIAEMIYMGSQIHKGILDLKLVRADEHEEMNQGNKLAVLCGDYLLASACTNLSKLQNTHVVDLMSQVIADMSQSIFDREFKTTKFSYLKLWYDRLNSNSSSLLANSAKAALILAQHPPNVQEAAFSFAKHLDITYKIWLELNDFKKDSSLVGKPDTLMNAVYLDTVVNEAKDDLDEPVYEQRESVTRRAQYLTMEQRVALNIAERSRAAPNQRVVDECMNLFQNHLAVANESLNLLLNTSSESEAIKSLKSILNLMKSTLDS